MNNPRPIIIALAFGLIAVILVYFYIKGLEGNGASHDIEMARVVRATTDIPPNQTIRDSMIEEVEVQADFVTPDMVTEMDDILGKVNMVAIYSQQPLMQQMFKATEQLEDISRLLEDGERGVTVGVTEVSGLGGNLRPGDKVDVMVTILDHDEVGVSSTFTVLRNVIVLAVGQNIGFTAAENEDGAISKSVTLKVDPFQDEMLALASEIGSIRLALRNPDDPWAPATDGTALTDFTTYTATRDDLQEAADRAREEARRAEEEYWRRIDAMGSNYIPPRDTDFTAVQAPPPSEPKDTVELILGGEVIEVEVDS
ncbi:MAG TPA: Flp pilus assembly protein CpaB [bacterium]|jgi:pilus assembly protein CpaB